MTNEEAKILDFYTQDTNRYLRARIIKVVDMTSTEAMTKTTKVLGDSPITIHCGGMVENWKSRFLAFHFYHEAAIACRGTSEGDRYWMIVDGFLSNEQIPHDDIPIRRRVA